MDCPHCGKAFHDQWNGTQIKDAGANDPTRWLARVTVCPACWNPTIRLVIIKLPPNAQPVVVEDFVTYPKGIFRRPTPKEVPEVIREDYEEACAVLSISAKASAALSRRCLQAILREKGYAQRDLAVQIDALLNETDPSKAISLGLRETVDAIRNFGNFSAHPVTDQTTLQILPVEPGEAEWCLDILDEMFDHYYVRPAQAAARKASLNAKLAAAGKPPSK